MFALKSKQFKSSQKSHFDSEKAISFSLLVTGLLPLLHHAQWSQCQQIPLKSQQGVDTTLPQFTTQVWDPGGGCPSVKSGYFIPFSGWTAGYISRGVPRQPLANREVTWNVFWSRNKRWHVQCHKRQSAMPSTTVRVQSSVPPLTSTSDSAARRPRSDGAMEMWKECCWYKWFSIIIALFWNANNPTDLPDKLILKPRTHCAIVNTQCVATPPNIEIHCFRYAV